MQDSEPRPPSERSDAPGGWQAAIPFRAEFPGQDPPTVRSAAAAGSSASSVKKVLLVPAVPPIPFPNVGEVIDEFTLESAIGVGGMGAVFQALDTKLDRRVALKILPPEQAHDAEVVQRFYQEGRAAAQLDHENIARVFTIGHDGRYHYIAFEYIEGTTVRQRVEQSGPLAANDAIDFTLQIADALVHAAERGVVHRDIKPSNIIVTPQGRAKLVDMGLARRFERGGDDGLTQSGMTLGTFDYISPEQARDPRDVDVRSDLYSLGCTLFHMLTGRPPFPEGTVLQKLIQHQEEPPPDVRSLNPKVPPELANILVKLMAKDRDRRYQTPEHLVRDLVSVAGALGLRTAGPEGLVWTSTAEPRGWEWHLIWAVPALAFLAIIAAIGWWTESGGRAPADGVVDNPPRVTVRSGSSSPDSSRSREGADPPSAAAQADAELFDPEMGEAVASPAVPRDILIDSSEDLLAVLAAAGPRSTIVLTDDGPYKLGHADRRPTVDRLVRRDLTIKADVGVRPVLRMTRESASGTKPRSALLEFVGGHVTFEGIVFVLEPGEGVESLTAVRAEDAETTFRRCTFRRQGSGTGAARCVALQLRSWTTPTADGDRPLATTLDQCHFGNGQIGVLASGPVDLTVRDCTFAASEPAFWLENGKSPTAVPAEFRLKHISILAGDGPVFRFEGTDARVWLEDSVVAAAEAEATLVACDLPDSLVWRGRSNLYARVGTFLQPLGGRPGRELTHDPLKWQETVDEIRESGSVFTSAGIWDESTAGRAQALDSSTPTRAFRLAFGHAGPSYVGARRGPSGALYPALRPSTIARAGTPANEGARDRKPAETVAQEDSRPSSGAVVPPPAGEPTSPVVSTRISEVPDMPVMPPASRDKTAVAATDPEETHPAETPAVVEPATPASVPHIRADARAEVAILRTVDQFMSALNEPGARGGLLRVDAGADWVLTGTQVRVAGTWRVQAEPGPSRPRLRFLADPADAKVAGAWPAMLELRSGSLQFEGFDIILPKTHAPVAGQGRWAVFHLAAATDLSLTDCTVTIEGDQPPSAVVAVSAADNENPARPGGEPPTATVRLFDCLLRAGGDLIDVAADRRLVVELNNAVVSTGGALVHAHGLPRGQVPEKVSLTIRQVSARNAGGLVHLESAPGEPELPLAEVNARDSILVTDSADAPLLRIDGQDAPAAMRDRIEWEGHGVAYGQINTYRRDRSAQLGVVPTLYDRRDWTVWVGSKESTPFHGDARFKREWDPERRPWSFVRDDARLANDSPVLSAGADLERIPNAPPG